MSSEISVEGKILKILLNQPKRKNCVNNDDYHKIAEALVEASRDPNIHVVYLTGVGDYFSSGNDLANFVLLGGESLAESCKMHGTHTLIPFVDAFIKCSKPIVVGVNGHACGIMVTILGLCDVVISADSATFYTPFSGLA
jgi:peroxisomal 3,2-trans-enoyl-CoA isomerase